jgi:hypothetical protein
MITTAMGTATAATTAMMLSTGWSSHHNKSNCGET